MKWKRDLNPMVICGTSGAGKTTVARALHHTWPGDCSIFFDLDDEPQMGTEVHDVEELRAALVREESTICVRTPATEVREPELFEETARYLMQLGQEIRGSRTRLQFLFDELQDLDERWVQICQKRLRKRNIKPVGLSQDPVSVPKRCRTIAEWNAWLSPPPGTMLDSLEQMRYPLEVLEAIDQFDMVVFGGDWSLEGRYRAPKEYVAE